MTTAVVYVESNFVLELALGQEQAASCREILAYCAAGRARLVTPAFSVAEPFHALGGRERRRRQTAEAVRIESGETSRSDTRADEAEILRGAVAALVRLGEVERAGLRDALEQILRVAELIPLTADVIREAAQSTRLSALDAIVLESVLAHLRAARPERSCFLNRNTRDFDEPGIVERLAALGCRLLPGFAGALAFLEGS